MSRARPALGTPFGADGPWLAAILDVLCDVRDGMDEVVRRLPAAAPPAPPTAVVRHVQEPAPAVPPAVPDDEPPGDPPDDSDLPALPEPEPQPEPDAEPTVPTTRSPAGEPPPRTGRGSSTQAWRTWAARAGVTVTDPTTRDDIIAACAQAGVI